MVRAVRQRLDFIGPFDWAIMGILVSLFVGAVFGSRAAHAASSGVDWYAWWDGVLQNSGTEMLGAFLTFVLLVVTLVHRQANCEKQRTDELKQTIADELQKQMHTFIQVQEIARLRAAKTPEERQPILNSMKGMNLLRGITLQDAKLTKAQLIGANFEGANLRRAHLLEANLTIANLKGTDLRGAILYDADLSDANLEGTDLWATLFKGADCWRTNFIRAYLRDADFTGVNLREANLTDANLNHARLIGADLKDANLENANFEGATLPDGTKLPGRSYEEREKGEPEPDWRTPFEAWDKAGRLREEL